jgi:hypothetical protein
MASTSNTVTSSQPGLRPLRLLLAPPDGTVMGRLYRVESACPPRQAAAIRYSVQA